MLAQVEEMGERVARRKAWDGREAIVLLGFRGSLAWSWVVILLGDGGRGRYNYFVATVAEMSSGRGNVSRKLQ